MSSLHFQIDLAVLFTLHLVHQAKTIHLFQRQAVVGTVPVAVVADATAIKISVQIIKERYVNIALKFEMCFKTLSDFV